MLQVEPKGEILVKPLNILDRREVTLWKRAITQVKVQWQHFGPDETTCKDEELMKQAYPWLFMVKDIGTMSNFRRVRCDATRKCKYLILLW